MINSYSKIKFYDDNAIIEMIETEVKKSLKQGINRKYTHEMTIDLIKSKLSKLFTELKIHLNQVYELDGKLYVKIRQGYVNSLAESNLVIKVKK